MTRPALVISVCVFLAACGSGAGGWTKAGADQTAAGTAYDDCRNIAETAVRTDIDIDQDIMATRGADWQRGSAGRVQTGSMQAHTQTRAGNIIEACMKAKGFSEAK